MADVLIKSTGEVLSSAHTPDYIDNEEAIINPTAEEIEQYKKQPTAEEIKQAQIMEIDKQIAYEMTRGYDFEGGTMSTSAAAQMNWSNVINRYNAGKDIPIPFPVSLKNGDIYELDTVEKVVDLFTAASLEIESRHNTLLLQRAAIARGE